jgi:hypothetical protein
MGSPSSSQSISRSGSFHGNGTFVFGSIKVRCLVHHMCAGNHEQIPPVSIPFVFSHSRPNLMRRRSNGGSPDLFPLGCGRRISQDKGQVTRADWTQPRTASCELSLRPLPRLVSGASHLTWALGPVAECAHRAQSHQYDHRRYRAHYRSLQSSHH